MLPEISFQIGERDVSFLLAAEPFHDRSGDPFFPTHSVNIELVEIFVMGDNRLVSLDSRYKQIGLIDVNNVIGKAQVVAFPFDRIKYLY